MEKAKEFAKELIENFDKVDRQVREEMKEKLKPEINNLLHSHLPDDVTVKQVEILGMVIFDMIYNPYDYVGSK